jgi:hypothetical protein
MPAFILCVCSHPRALDGDSTIDVARQHLGDGLCHLTVHDQGNF